MRGREEVLELLDELRRRAEAGEIVALVALPIGPGKPKEFQVISQGDISMLELAGLLGRAWLDAEDGLRETYDEKKKQERKRRSH